MKNAGNVVVAGALEMGLEDFEKLTDNQKKILDVYYETFSIQKACKFAGVDSSYIYNMTRAGKNTPFARAFRQLTDDLEKDPRLGKLGGIENLKDIAKRAKADGRYDIELKVQQEINKMIEKNLAVQKTATETVNIDIKGTIDLTHPQIEQGVDYEKLEYAEETS